MQPTLRKHRAAPAVQANPGNLPPPLVLLAAAALVLAAMLPLLRYPLPPIADYPNHLARLYVIAANGADPDLARFYRIDWVVIPNLAMDLIVPPLARLIGIYAAGQLFTVLSAVAIVTGTFALNRALLGRVSLTPLLGLPFLYNQVLLVGTTNYLLGVGLAMWALAAWKCLRERSALVRLPLAALLVAVLFVCHLYAVGLFGLGLLAIETSRLLAAADRPPSARARDFLLTGLAFLPVLPLLMAGPTSELAGRTYWELAGKLDGLQVALTAYSSLAALAILAALALSTLVACRNGWIRLHPAGWLLLAFGGALYLAMPRMLFDSHMADQRLPIALLFMLLATLDVRLPNRNARIGMAALCVGMVAVRVSEVETVWSAQSATTTSIQASLRHIPRGSRVLVVSADETRGYDVADYALVHAASLATIEASALTTRAFTVRGKQLLHTTPAYHDAVDRMDGAPPSLERLLAYTDRRARRGEYIYWQRWPQRFDYLYVYFTAADAQNPDPVHLELVHAASRFQLYRIRPPDHTIPGEAAASR